MCIKNESVNNAKNVFIKLLMLSSKDKGFVLLYGFCVQTEQTPYQWKIRKFKKTKKCIWTAILSPEEADVFIQNLTQKERIILSTENFSSPELIMRPIVYVNDGVEHIPGPVEEFSHVCEYWNIHKHDLYYDIKSALGSDGKGLYLDMQNLFEWMKTECGIDFTKCGERLGNLECYNIPSSQEKFTISTIKETGLKQTTILKQGIFEVDLIVNCTAEHRNRSVLNQTKIFRAKDSSIDFFADEAMSRVIVQIWEKDSGKLIFSKDITLMMSVSLGVSLESPTYQILDPWVEKLFNSASNRSDVIEQQIVKVSRNTKERPISIKSDTLNDIDVAMQEGQLLFGVYMKTRARGAYIANTQMDGEINSFIKIREYIEYPSVKKVTIVDPYFSIQSAQKLLARIPRTDVELDIISSITDTDPDTGCKSDVLQNYRKFLADNESIIHPKLVIRNLSRGNKPVFHDRYLILYFENGQIDGYLLSNSLNSMGQLYPFVIAPMDRIVCNEVCDYLNNLCDSEVQARKPRNQRVSCEVLHDYKNKMIEHQAVTDDSLPFATWLSPELVNDNEPKVDVSNFSKVVTILWSHWNSERKLTCKMLSALGSKIHSWIEAEIVSCLKSMGDIKHDYIDQFIVLATEAEAQQDHKAKGLQSEVYTLWLLLNGNAKPDRIGFSQVFDRAGHIWYGGNPWLRGGYALLLWLDASRYINFLEQIKSPLMFDLLATRMLFYPWSQSLYIIAANSSNLCIRLLSAEYLYYQLQENRMTFSQIECAFEGLIPEVRAFQISYILSQLVFHARATRVIKLDEESINKVYKGLITRLSEDLPQCTEESQELSLYWLFDCEECSNCNLLLDLAKVESNLQVKEKIYKKILFLAEKNLTKIDYPRDISKITEFYLVAISKLYGEKSESELIKRIIDWNTFEIATEPARKNYDYQKWNDSYIRSQRQLYILGVFVSLYPSATKARAWLDEWKPRLEYME